MIMKIKNLILCYGKGQEFIKNKLPIGFIFKLIFISNFGDKEMISLKKFELYDEKNNLLSNYIIIHDNYNENYLNDNNKDKINNM